MPENESTGPQDVEATDTPETPTQGEPEAPEADDDMESLKRHSRKWEERAKTNLRDLEKATGERDELAKRLEEVTAERDRMVAEHERKALVTRVAKETGVDPSLIRGSTEDELREHADAIKAAMVPPKPHVTGYADRPAHTRDETSEFLRNLFKPNT